MLTAEEMRSKQELLIEEIEIIEAKLEKAILNMDNYINVDSLSEAMKDKLRQLGYNVEYNEISW